MDELSTPLKTGFDVIIDKGGPVMVILAILSIIVVAVVVYKCAKLALMLPAAKAERAVTVWEQGDVDEARLLAQGDGLAALVGVAIMARCEAPNDMEVARTRTALTLQQKLIDLRSGFRFLELVSSVAPLLGLLGTVLGMIEAFRQLEEAGARVNPSLLAGGIWQALLTTAAGMCVALICVMCLAGLEAMLARISNRMENFSTRIFLVKEKKA